MQRAIGLKAEAVLGQRDVTGIIAVEIFAQHFIGTFADAVAQRLADADAFSRNPEGHGKPRLAGLGESRLNRFAIGATRAERFQAGGNSSNKSQVGKRSELCLSRRRCTEEGIRMASRYFATVRRAISMPDSRKRSTMVSSERIADVSSASISCLM